MGLIEAFIAWLKSLLEPAPAPPSRGINVPEVVAPRVMVIDFDPTVDEAGMRLGEKMGWNNVDLLIQEYIEQVGQASGGLVQYQYSGANRLDVDAFPVKADGFCYTAAQYLDVLRSEPTHHQPDAVDYSRILADFDLVRRINDCEIDEVWLFGGPYFGFWESTMVGPGAFWCNSAPLGGVTGCQRRFVIMGFNTQRGVTEMLHNLGHRAESTLARVYNAYDWLFNAYAALNPAAAPPPATGLFANPGNDFEHLLLYDKIAPGRAGLGLIHAPPNGQQDYDWSSHQAVLSSCDDWLNFPALQGARRLVSCEEWGCSQHGFILWWLAHLPHAAGSQNGVLNNWWRYIMQVDLPYP